MQWRILSKRLCAILSVFCLAFSLCSPVFATDSSDVALAYNSLSGSLYHLYQYLPDPSSSETKYLPFNAEAYASNYLRYSPYWYQSSYSSTTSSANYSYGLTAIFNEGIKSTPVHCIFSISLLTNGASFSVNNAASISAFVLSGGSEYGFADAISVSFVNQVPWGSIYEKKFADGTAASDWAAPRIYRVDINRNGGSWDALVDGFTLSIDNWATMTKTGTQIRYSPLLFNCYAWYDTGDSAIDDVVSSILEHVASIDGKMDTVHASLMQIITQLQELNKDTDTIVDLLTSIDTHLSNVDQTTSDIYKLLRETLTDESTELSNASKSAAETIMQQQDSEQYWTDKNTDTFEKLDLNNFSFSDSILSGLQLVGNMFSSVWSAIGDVSIIYIFPLTLGVALVVIGRIAKSGGKGHKKDGGDSS